MRFIPNRVRLAAYDPVPRSVSEYWGGLRYERHGARCEASDTTAMPGIFKCREQSRSPHAAILKGVQGLTQIHRVCPSQVPW